MAETVTGYKSVKDLKSADDLAERRKQLQDLRSSASRDWALNRAFVEGNQWAFYNKVNGQVESLPTEDGDKARYQVRLISNQLLPGSMAYVAMLTKTKPQIYATPDSTAHSDRKAAEMGERLFEYWWHELKLTTRLQQALHYSLRSKGYWKITWDPLAGKPMRFTINPEDGQPITNDQVRELFVAELRRNEMDPREFERQVNLGDIHVEVMQGEDVWLSPGATTPDDADYAICRHAMSPEEIKARYKKDIEPDTMSKDDDSLLTFGQVRVEKRVTRMLKDVFVGYFRPTAALPQGRYVVWVEDQNQILADTAWEYPFQELPLVQFPGQGSEDRPLFSDARPIQKELNRTLSQIVMYKNLTIRPQAMAPTNSLVNKLTTEPGAVISYNPVAGLKPEWRDMPALPPSVFNTLDNIQTRLDRLFNLQAVSRGDVPPNVEAGVAIDLLQEAAVDQVAPLIQRIEDALAHAGMMMAKLAQEYYIEPRLLKIKGPSGSNQVYHFKQADLQGGFTFHAEAGSGLPRTRAGRIARIEKLINMGIMTPQQAARELDLADMRSVTSAMAVDEDHATREHDKMLHSQPLFPSGYQDWVMQIQQGQDPESGQPIVSQQQVQMLVTKALVLPTPYENMALHLQVHGDYLKTSEFENLPQDVQQRHLMHFELTKQASQQALPQVQPEPVKTNLHLQGTLGPSAAAAILSGSGVPVSPEMMTELPLETNVYDSVDKADAEEAGNDPLTQMETMLTMTQAQDEHTVKLAEAQAKTGLAVHRLERAQSEAINAEETHIQNTEHKDQAQKAKMRKLQRTSQERK
jgi:hypothetical protein